MSQNQKSNIQTQIRRGLPYRKKERHKGVDEASRSFDVRHTNLRDRGYGYVDKAFLCLSRHSFDRLTNIVKDMMPILVEVSSGRSELLGHKVETNFQYRDSILNLKKNLASFLEEAESSLQISYDKSNFRMGKKNLDVV